MALFRRRNRYPDVDVMGRRFGPIDEVEAEVNDFTAGKRAQLEDIERRLAELDLDPANDADRTALLKERKKLRTFFWLLSGGDRRGEPEPD